MTFHSYLYLMFCLIQFLKKKRPCDYNNTIYYIYTYVYMQSKTQQIFRWYYYVICNTDDGPLTRPKHAVVYYRVLHIT